jgi:uncharacterized protein (UPF0332 family)
MTENIYGRRQETASYLQRAKRVLEVAELTQQGGFFVSTVNRAYYAFFYAANAALASQGMAQREHDRAFDSFEEYFVQPGLIEESFGQRYGRVLDACKLADFEIHAVPMPEQARETIIYARRFVDRVETMLHDEGWL